MRLIGGAARGRRTPLARMKVGRLGDRGKVVDQSGCISYASYPTSDPEKGEGVKKRDTSVGTIACGANIDETYSEETRLIKLSLSIAGVD